MVQFLPDYPEARTAFATDAESALEELKRNVHENFPITELSFHKYITYYSPDPKDMSVVLEVRTNLQMICNTPHWCFVPCKHRLQDHIENLLFRIGGKVQKGKPVYEIILVEPDTFLCCQLHFKCSVSDYSNEEGIP